MTTSVWRGDSELSSSSPAAPHFFMSTALQLVASAIEEEEPSSTTDELDTEVAKETGSKRAMTIVASDNEVANGFVKDGKRLPYVFETTESGSRRRSSKILPVCGVCGKRFVCVTTMKRHLVTHTGEKPFSCKICGKQYTQKGNLRVHERTHRNDRPFECNICGQKFYRKEPMQKHQWRQHGIVHFKARNNGHNCSSHTAKPTEESGTVVKTGAVGPVLYNSLVEQIRASGAEESSRHLSGQHGKTKEDALATDTTITKTNLSTTNLSTTNLSTTNLSSNMSSNMSSLQPMKLKKLLTKAYERETALHTDEANSQPLDLSNSQSQKRVRSQEMLPTSTIVIDTNFKPSAYLASLPLEEPKTNSSKAVLATTANAMRLMPNSSHWNADRTHNARTV